MKENNTKCFRYVDGEILSDKRINKVLFLRCDGESCHEDGTQQLYTEPAS